MIAHQRQFTHNIGTKSATSVDACKEVCASNTYCKAATFQATTASCFLHNGLGAPTSHERFDHLVKMCTGNCIDFFGRVVQLLSMYRSRMRIKSSHITINMVCLFTSFIVTNLQLPGNLDITVQPFICNRINKNIKNKKSLKIKINK